MITNRDVDDLQAQAKSSVYKLRVSIFNTEPLPPPEIMPLIRSVIDVVDIILAIQIAQLRAVLRDSE